MGGANQLVGKTNPSPIRSCQRTIFRMIVEIRQIINRLILSFADMQTARIPVPKIELPMLFLGVATLVFVQPQLAS